MNFIQAATTVACMALVSAVFEPAASADDWNRKTVVTFTVPVEIPGVHLKGWGVLPAGTYVFKILDSQSDRHIVQIFNQDETTVYATILAIPNYRLKATDKTVITFRERASGEPEALRAWFYPGRNWGEEFVYPKSQAVLLAKGAKVPVLFVQTELPVEIAEPVKFTAAVEEFKSAPVMAIQPSGDEVEATAVVTAPPAEMATPAALPATASSLALLALFGLLALGAAMALRAAEQHARDFEV